jgi:hypothetical protein
MTRRQRDLYSWTVVRLPERDLAESVLDLAAPLLERLTPAPSIEADRDAIELGITFWNAHVAASKLWGDPRPKALTELRKRMGGKQAAPGDAATFDLLLDRWRDGFAFDPRLVRSWTYDADKRGTARLVCEMGLPDGVKAEVPPPIEKRISIGGKFLDEVRIRRDVRSYLSFPVESHRAEVDDDGIAMVHTKMPSALQLFAEGRLPRASGDPVEVIIGGRKLGPMVLAEVRCGGEYLQHDVAVLVFKPASDGAPR